MNEEIRTLEGFNFYFSEKHLEAMKRSGKIHDFVVTELFCNINGEIKQYSFATSEDSIPENIDKKYGPFTFLGKGKFEKMGETL